MRSSPSVILQAIEKTGLVPLFYHSDVSTATQVIEAAYRGGARVFEFANRGPNALTVFRELVNRFSTYTDFHLGIGTIMNASQANEFIDAGAKFLVSPIFKHEIADVAHREDPLDPGHRHDDGNCNSSRGRCLVGKGISWFGVGTGICVVGVADLTRFESDAHRGRRTYGEKPFSLV